jgi:RNA polymerase sigma-70 factor (ECF subfamily)
MAAAFETAMAFGTVQRGMRSAPARQRRLLRTASEAAMQSDEELVAQARSGSEDAFRALMDRHRVGAYRLALRITRSREDAEDVAQQAFVRAWYALGQFRGESAFGTWLHRIVVRRALDRATEMKARQDRESDLEPAGLSLADSRREGRDVILAMRIDKLMRCLTPVQRAAVTLYYWKGSRSRRSPPRSECRRTPSRRISVARGAPCARHG